MPTPAEPNAAPVVEELDAVADELAADVPASGEQPSGDAPAETDAPAEESAEGAEKTDEAEGDKPEDKAKEPAPEAKRAWRQVEAAKRAQVQTARARQQLEQDTQRVRDFESQLQRERSELDRSRATLDQREARIRPLEEALERRDLSALVTLGFDYERWTRDAMEANTPAGIARRALEENERTKKRLEERDDQAQQRAQVEEQRTIARNLVGLVDESPDECPELYAWRPERIAQEGLDERARLWRKNRRPPTYDEVLVALQKRARDEADVANKRSEALKQRKSAQARDAGSAGKVDPKGNSGSPNAPALTAKGASERLPPTPREKTEAEIDAECLAELKALRR